MIGKRRKKPGRKADSDLNRSEARCFYLIRMVKRCERTLLRLDREIIGRGLPEEAGARERFLNQQTRAMSIQRQALMQLAAERRSEQGGDLPAPFEVEGEGGGEEGE
jgi:hypothetical protein